MSVWRYAFGWLVSSFCCLAWGGDFDYRLEPRRIAADTYAFIGSTGDFSRDNGGNIVNTGFVVTKAGVVVIDSGPSRRYGEQMRAAIGRITSLPVIRVFNTHHHPDHFLGNQAYAGVPIAALPSTLQGERDEGSAFADNVYRMAGDWAGGTEVYAANSAVKAGREEWGGHDIELLALAGHTESDLAIFDRTTGVLFAGDLAFYKRAPTTPHADLAAWHAALDRLAKLPFRVMLPGHGEPVNDKRAIEQTRRYLSWLEATLRRAAERGQEMTEVLATPIPAEFSDMSLAKQEFARSVAHLFRRYEQESLQAARLHEMTTR